MPHRLIHLPSMTTNFLLSNKVNLKQKYTYKVNSTETSMSNLPQITKYLLRVLTTEQSCNFWVFQITRFGEWRHDARHNDHTKYGGMPVFITRDWHCGVVIRTIGIRNLQVYLKTQNKVILFNSFISTVQIKNEAVENNSIMYIFQPEACLHLLM